MGRMGRSFHLLDPSLGDGVDLLRRFSDAEDSGFASSVKVEENAKQTLKKKKRRTRSRKQSMSETVCLESAVCQNAGVTACVEVSLQTVEDSVGFDFRHEVADIPGGREIFLREDSEARRLPSSGAEVRMILKNSSDQEAAAKKTTDSFTVHASAADVLADDIRQVSGELSGKRVPLVSYAVEETATPTKRSLAEELGQKVEFDYDGIVASGWENIPADANPSPVRGLIAPSLVIVGVEKADRGIVIGVPMADRTNATEKAPRFEDRSLARVMEVKVREMDPVDDAKSCLSRDDAREATVGSRGERLRESSPEDGEERLVERTQSVNVLLRREVLRIPMERNQGSPLGTPRCTVGTADTPRMTEWERMTDAGASLALPPLDLSPVQFLSSEISGGGAIHNTSSPGTDLRRERVYNTMFHVPWRCELLITVGCLVCLDSFLSVFTTMPIRIAMAARRHLKAYRRPVRPNAEELCDFCSLFVMVLGVAFLQQTEIGLIYHWIRGQAIIKLYVVFNVLEIIDRLCQSFGSDVLQVLYNTAGRVAKCAPHRVPMESVCLAFDECIAVICYVLHSLIIMLQAITLNVAINSHNNALLTLLISNNFVEIKGNVFKRLGKDNLHKLAYLDTVERFHIASHLLFVLAQNFRIKEEPWLFDFALNAGKVLLCEVVVDVVKHAFLAKFNEIKPDVYSQFLQSLCRQTVQTHSHQVHKTLMFVPLAPAIVVVRVLSPIFMSMLPKSPLWWKFIVGTTYIGLVFVVLLGLKVLLGLGLQIHARWYLNRCLRKEKHLHHE